MGGGHGFEVYVLGVCEIRVEWSDDDGLVFLWVQGWEVVFDYMFLEVA